MLVELSKMEQRYQAVLAVQVDGVEVTVVAEKLGVSRQTVHRWLRRYEEGGLEGLADRSHRPVSCPHQMPAAVEGTYTNLPDAFIDASASITKRRKSPGTTVFCSSGAWALDHQGGRRSRPGTTASRTPTASFEADHLGGEVTGLTVIPSWAGVDNHLYLCKADDPILLESSTFNF